MKRIVILLLSVLFCVTIISCSKAPSKILYINSYHEGYGSSDDVMEGIQEILKDKNVELEIFFMDTKRHNDDLHIAKMMQQVLRKIIQLNPDVIIASDDNAVKYIVEPYLKEGSIPVVFCGVNWSCEQYGLPTDYVTGMLEVLPIEPTIETLKEYFPDMKKLTVLSENTTSEKSNKALLDPIYRSLNLEPEYLLVDHFAQWKEAFVQANQSSDIVFLPTNGAVKNWDEAEAIEFIQNNIKVPVFTCDDFMMKYSVFGLTKIAQEQGEWAAQTALEILKGKDPKEIAVTKNSQTKVYITKDLAGRIGFKPREDLLKRLSEYKD